jgi:hypothetical protein
VRVESAPPIGEFAWKAEKAARVSCRGARHLDLDTLLVDPEGKVVLAYLAVAVPPPLRADLRTLPTQRGQRSQGLRHDSRTFGYIPRRTWKRELCRVSSLDREHPEVREGLIEMGLAAEARYAEVAPDTFSYHAEAATRILPEWLLPGAQVFSGGIVNRNSALAYHRDSGNIAETFSAMVAVRSAVDGGHLHMPEVGLCLPVHDGSLTIFNGQAWVHGVTPMRVRPGGYRLTFVYYTLAALWQCLPIEEEVARSQAVNTDRTRRRAAHPLNQSKIDRPALKDLIKFAAIEVASGDLEPWAVMIGALDVPPEDRAWLVKLYNAFDDLGSAWNVYRRWPSPAAWAAAPDRDEAATYPCTQERRNLRGGKVVRHLASYVEVLDGREQLQWLKEALGDLDPEAGWVAVSAEMRRIWGVGRQTAFEWAEFAEKSLGLPISAPDAALWDSTGPRRSLERLYGAEASTPADLDRWAAEVRGVLDESNINLPWEDFETVICDFNVMRDGRYYPGRHLAALAEEVRDAPDNALLIDAWDATVVEPWRRIAPGIDPAQARHYRDTGEIITGPVGIGRK